jgi:hypothetical protein
MNENEPKGDHIAVMTIDPRAFLGLWMEGYESHCWRVLADGLPQDVKVQSLTFHPDMGEMGLIRIIVEHPSFPENSGHEPIMLLPPPQIAIGHDDHEHAPRAAFAEY